MKVQTIYLLVLIILISCQKKTSDSLTTPTEPVLELPEPIQLDLDQILERGKIIGILENNTTGYFIYKGQTLGFQYEMLSNFADYLGVDLVLAEVPSIRKAYEMLKRGEGDIMAFPLTVTKSRKKNALFTDYQYTTRMVLVQRYPEGFENMKAHEIEASMIRNQVELINKEIHVRYNSSYRLRLVNLSEEIGGDIVIIEESDEFETEDMIAKVANGEFDFTVVDEDIALVNSTYYNNIDISTPISFPTQIAWSVRLTSPKLRDTLNVWQRKIKKEPTFNVLYNKYFRNTKASLNRKRSDFFSASGGKISEYDDLIKEAALVLNWDWRLLASQVYQESQFNSKARSWAGAVGLMQIVPETGKEFGATNLLNAKDNIKTGTRYLQWLESYWEPRLESKDPILMRKFILASYNVGIGHVIDAQALAKKYGEDPEVWEESVEKYLLLKSKPKYYNDPVVKSGYCRGAEPVQYVKNILKRFEEYSHSIPKDSVTSTD